MTDKYRAKRIRKMARELDELMMDCEEMCSIDAATTVNDLMDLAKRLDGKEEGE